MNRRLRPLDGLRGVAIGLVVLAHFYGTVNLGPASRILTPLADTDAGVLIFFVISGYLITSILLREQRVDGSISLRRFYTRRILRIWPAFYVFLAAMLVLSLTTSISDLSAGALAAAALFVWNYAPAGEGWYLGHMWSLSIEEQFYLLWPSAMSRLTIRRAAQLALAIVVVEPVIRVANYFLLPGTRPRIPVYFHDRADSLLLGCALALLPVAYPDLFSRLAKAVFQWRLHVISALFMALVTPFLAARFEGGYLLTIGWTAESLATAIVLLSVVEAEDSVMGRALSWGPLVHLGAISYSLYLWQQLYLTPLNTTFLGKPPINLIAAVLTAEASYRFVERPFLRLKRRYEGPRSARQAEGQRTATAVTS